MTPEEIDVALALMWLVAVCVVVILFGGGFPDDGGER